MFPSAFNDYVYNNFVSFVGYSDDFSTNLLIESSVVQCMTKIENNQKFFFLFKK